MSSKSRKLGLIGTIFVSLLSISSAAVSTFAWFQANAQVKIKTSGTYTNISVSKPDEYTFYYYKGNGDSSYVASGTFSNDFSTVDTSTFTENKTLWTGIFPGQSMVFAMRIDNLNTTSGSVTLSINKFISNDIHKQSQAQSDYKRLVRNTSSLQVNVGWAMDIYSLSSSSNSAYYANSYESSSKNFLNTFNTNNASTPGDGIIEDHFNFSATNNALTDDLTLSSGTYNSQEIEHEIVLIDGETPSATTMYYFFRVYYSRAASTLYVENNGDSTNVLVEPAADSASGRYFTPNTLGNSNCYAGLTFALTKMTLTW